MIALKKTSIKDLKLDKNGEIANYPDKLKQDDKVLYDALKKRLVEFGGDGKKAFSEPFFKPTKSGLYMNRVKAVKLEDAMGDGIEVNGGIANNGDMIRVDIFEKGGKNYMIPVYTIDYYNKKLPNKICKGNAKGWPVLDDSYNFKFSIFHNDVIKIKSKEGIKFLPCDKKAEKKAVVLNDLFVYFISADRSNGSIYIETLDKKYFSRGVGIQSLLEFEKYEIDLLGNLHKCKKQVRKEFK